MLAAFFALALFSVAGPSAAAPSSHRSVLDNPTGGSFLMFTAETVPTQSLRDSLNNTLMDKVHAMNAQKQGIFQEDVSAIVAPYFPAGQSFAETKKIIHDQDLGTLLKFKGMQDPAGGTMYVTKFSLMGGIYSDVYVVLNFDFTGQPETGMTLKKTSAFLRASSM